MKLLLTLVLWSSLVFAQGVIMEPHHSQNWFRLYNTSNYSYYCWVILKNGYKYQDILQPGYATPWFLTNNYESCGCRR